MSRLGRARATGETSETTILPTWLPTDPPLVLAAGFASDLVAFETFTPGAPPRWRFHAGGTVYGQPAYDREGGRVYFGASDKRLYALDTRGLFLWSFETKDNVAARPLVVDDLLVAAGEDGTVYGLDAATGRERWTYEAGGGIVSWPALVGHVIVVGTDGGEVLGLDPATGGLLWTLAAGGAVEAPIVVDEEDGTAYVASRDGSLAAFKPSDCTAKACEAAWSVEPGGSLRTAPLLAEDRVLVVDEEGAADRPEQGGRQAALVARRGALRRRAGPGRRGGSSRRRRAGRSSGSAWKASGWVAGTPARRPARPMASRRSRTGRSSAATASGSATPTPSSGGWAPRRSARSRPSRWPGSTRPAARRSSSSQLRTTIAEYDGKAIAVDLTQGVFVLDPATGAGSRLADLPGEGSLSQVDPIVVGDTLLAIGGRTMQALDLRTAQLRWQGIAPGTTIRPPTVIGADRPLGEHRRGAGLAARPRPRQRHDALEGSLGPVGAGWRRSRRAATTAFTSTPPAAWDLQSGAAALAGAARAASRSADRRCRRTDRPSTSAGSTRPATTGTVAALDAATGAVVWQVDLEDAVMSPLDQLWAQDGLVVVPDLNGKVIVLDAETGAERWRFAPPVGRLGTITVARDRVWFMLENARLYGLDLATGRPVARLTELELSLNGQGLTQRPTFVGDRLLFPAGLMLLGLEPPGGRAVSARTPAHPLPRPPRARGRGGDGRRVPARDTVRQRWSSRSRGGRGAGLLAADPVRLAGRSPGRSATSSGPTSARASWISGGSARRCGRWSGSGSGCCCW